MSVCLVLLVGVALARTSLLTLTYRFVHFVGRLMYVGLGRSRLRERSQKSRGWALRLCLVMIP